MLTRIAIVVALVLGTASVALSGAANAQYRGGSYYSGYPSSHNYGGGF